MDNFDKIELLNKQNRINKAYEEKKLRQKIIVEKNEMQAIQQEKEKASDSEYLEKARREMLEQQERIQRQKEIEKAKLLQIYEDNQRKQILHKKEVQRQKQKDAEDMEA